MLSYENAPSVMTVNTKLGAPRLADVPFGDHIIESDWDNTSMSSKIASYTTLSEVQRLGGEVQGKIIPDGEGVRAPDGVTGLDANLIEDSSAAITMKNTKDFWLSGGQITVKSSSHAEGSPSLNMSTYYGGDALFLDVDAHSPADNILAHTWDAVNQASGHSYAIDNAWDLYYQSKLDIRPLLREGSMTYSCGTQDYVFSFTPEQIGNMSEYFDPYSDTEQVPDPEPEDM